MAENSKVDSSANEMKNDYDCDGEDELAYDCKEEDTKEGNQESGNTVQDNLDSGAAKPKNASKAGDKNGSGDVEISPKNSSYDNNINETNKSRTENDSDNAGSVDKESFSEESHIFPSVIITEFLPNPEGSDGKNEFIEIYNESEEEVNLQGWSLKDKLGKAIKFIVSGRIVIKPKEYKVFYSDETGIFLNNSGDGIVLRDNKDNLIDETAISDSALEGLSYSLDGRDGWQWSSPTPGEENVIGLLYARDEHARDEKGEITNVKREGANRRDLLNNKTLNSPVNKNSISEEENIRSGGMRKESYDFSDSVLITEVYPNPKGRDNRDGNYEWIELYNDSRNDVNLKGWKIDDVLGKGSSSYVIKEDLIISSGGYTVLNSKYTKLILNNAGDEVNVLWPDDTVVDRLEYTNSLEGWSYNLSNKGNWVWSFVVTPGSGNVIKKQYEAEELNKIGPTESKSLLTKSIGVLDKKETKNSKEKAVNNENAARASEVADRTAYIETTIENARKLPRYTKVIVSGIVSSTPGIFSEKYFYISGSGIQVYSSEAKFPVLNIGDRIKVAGRLSEIGGEKRILLDNAKSDIEIVSHDNLLEPKIIQTGDVGESTEGYLATIEGTVTQVRNDVFFVDDGTGQVKIYIKPLTEIEKPEIEKGDRITVTGQISRTSSGYRILPRFQSDIKINGLRNDPAGTQAFGFQDIGETLGNRTVILAFFVALFIIFIFTNFGIMKRKREKKQ